VGEEGAEENENETEQVRGEEIIQAMIDRNTFLIPGTIDSQMRTGDAFFFTMAKRKKTSI